MKAEDFGLFSECKKYCSHELACWIYGCPNIKVQNVFVNSTARREALNHFLLFGEKQLNNILTEYISYYNNRRTHQGIGLQSPKGYTQQESGEVFSTPVLSGLWYDY
jgi:transposase InsO family protein